MMRTPLITALVAAFLLSVLPLQPAVAGTTSDDVASKTEDWMHTFKGYMLEKKKDAVKYGKELLDKSDRLIDELENKTEDASGDAKTAYAKAIKDLKQKRAAAARKLDAMGDATQDSWDDAKKGFSEAYKALYDATKSAIKEFK